MSSIFRLQSGSMFDRSEADLQVKPLRIIFLSVEGNDTEVCYLSHVHKFRDLLDIKTGVHIHTLKRQKSDTNSAPSDVLELLEEYLVIRNTDNLPKRIRDQIPGIYSIEFIKSYLEVQKKHNTKLKKNRCLTEIVPYLVYLFNNHSEIIIPHI